MEVVQLLNSNQKYNLSELKSPLFDSSLVNQINKLYKKSRKKQSVVSMDDVDALANSFKKLSEDLNRIYLSNIELSCLDLGIYVKEIHSNLNEAVHNLYGVKTFEDKHLNVVVSASLEMFHLSCINAYFRYDLSKTSKLN